jgi:transcription elongation factor GreA
MERLKTLSRSLFYKLTNIMSVNYYTEEGLKKLRDELQELKTKGRSDMAKQIAEARDKGDLSENAEYDAAKDAQGMLEMKISKLEDLVSNARVINQSTLDTSKVSIMTKVKLKNHNNKMELTYTLVAEEEANLKENKISVKSPIGQGLIGKKKGEIAEVKIPAGVLKLEILDISL